LLGILIYINILKTECSRGGLREKTLSQCDNKNSRNLNQQPNNIHTTSKIFNLDISKLLLTISLLLLVLAIPVVADDSYKPYLHEANVPEHPKVRLYGSYSTDLFPGSATYTYPIEIPEGTNGLKPSISITYNSQTLELRPGILGAGWTTTKNYVYRDVNSTPDDTSDDNFKLLLNDVSYDLVYVPSDGFYHTKIESFIRIQNLTGASNSYGSYWLVTLRDGTQYRFGYNLDSELTSNTGRSYALRWSLDQIKDTHDNKIFYSYLEDPNAEDKGAVYLSKIEYNNDRQRKIQFSYEASVRSDIRTVYEQGNVVAESRRLINIDVSSNGALVRKYTFEYTDLNSEMSLSSLSKIKYLGSDGSSILHQISFEYYQSSPGFTKSTSQWTSPTSFSLDDKDYGVRLVDLNRDGFIDIIKARQVTGEMKVWINDKNNGWIDATSTWSPPVWITKSPAIRKYLSGWLEFAYFDRYGYGMVRFTCPTNYNNQSVEGCEWGVSYMCGDSWNGYSTGNTINPGEEYVRCYYGGKGVNLYSMCCMNESVHNCDGTPIDCCDKIEIREMNGCVQDVCVGSKTFWPNDGTVSWCAKSWAYRPYTTIEPDNGVRFVDFNNDGLVDILQGVDGVSKAWINNGNGWTDVSSMWAPPVDFASNVNDQGVQFVDFNGDGRIDLLQAVNRDGNEVKKAWINNGNGWTDVSLKWQPPIVFVNSSRDTGARVEDVNGDGLPDIIFANDTTKNAWLNTGNNWTDASSVWSPPATFITSNSNGSDNGVRFADVNGDGLVDILEDYANGTRTDRGAWINSGHGWIYNIAWQSPEPFTKDGKNIGRRVADVNGDGFADIVVAHTNSSGDFKWTWLRNQNTPFVLKKITNELGGITSISYRSSTGFNNNGEDSLSDIGFNIWVVGNVNQDNSMSNSFKAVGVTSYGYANGNYDYQDFEFRGFGKVNETLPDNSLAIHYFHQDKARKGKEYRTEIYNSDGNIFSKVENIFDKIDLNGYFKVLLSSQTNYLYDGILNNPKTTKVSYSYDNFGNFIERVSNGDVNVAGDEKDEKYFYVINTTAWIVNKPSEYQLFSSDYSTKVKDMMYSYDGNSVGGDVSKGDVTQIETWINPSTGERHVVRYEYDNYGNVIRVIDPLNRVKSFNYGVRDTTFTYLDSSTNVLSQRTDYKYDLGTGNLLWTVEAGANRSYYYDVFGRIVKEVQPFDSFAFPTKSYTYTFDGISPEVIKVTSLASANKIYDFYFYYDGFGNFIQYRKPADGNQQIVKNFFYDGLGRVVREQNPYFDSFSTDLNAPSSTIGSTSYIYDPLGRVYFVLNPDGTNKTINFNRDIITAYDENGHRKAYILDAYDRITKVLEYNNKPTMNQNFETDVYNTSYVYDTVDNLIKINDNLGNFYSFTYDSLGRRIALSDPDLGEWIYTYDLNGNLITQKQQGTGNLVTGDGYYRDYDALNQLIRIRNGSTPTSPILENYTYDPFGQRIKLQINDSAKTKIYTPFKEFMRVVNSSGTYDYTYIYQDGTLVARLNPDGSKYCYHSDHLGSTSLITDKNGNVSENTFYSPYGEVLSGGKKDLKLYTGQFMDFPCQYYYGRRYYSPCMGIFNQPDQISLRYNPQSLNHYSYALNNPYGYKDDSGNIPVPLITGGIGAGVGFFSSLGIQLWQNHGDLSKINWQIVAISTGVGFISGATFGLGTAALGTGFAGTVASGAISNIAGGQASIALTNLQTGKPVTSNLFQPEDLAIQGTVGAGAAGIGYGIGRFIEPVPSINEPAASYRLQPDDEGFTLSGFKDLFPEGVGGDYHDSLIVEVDSSGSVDRIAMHGTFQLPQPVGTQHVYHNEMQPSVQAAIVSQISTIRTAIVTFVNQAITSISRWLFGY
jgi:RHS repeat-associated protein